MRKLVIYWLFLTLSVKSQAELSSKLLQTATRSIRIAKAKTGRSPIYPSNRKHWPRWPYKKHLHPVEVNLCKPTYTTTENKTTLFEPKHKKPRTGVTDKIVAMNVGDNIFIQQPINQISPVVSGIAKRLRRTYKGYTVWPNTVEYTRLF